MIGSYKKIGVTFLYLCGGTFLTPQSWSAEEAFLSLSDEDNPFVSNELAVGQTESLKDNLNEDLIQELHCLNYDAQEYIECHEDLKNVYIQSKRAYCILLLMRQNAKAAKFGFPDLLQRHFRNDVFRSVVGDIPMILSAHSCTFMMGDDNLEVKLPEGHKIILPTLQPIIEGIKDLNILTEEGIANSLTVLNDFVPKMVDILNHIATEGNIVWDLLHENAEKVDIVQEKISRNLKK